MNRVAPPAAIPRLHTSLQNSRRVIMVVEGAAPWRRSEELMEGDGAGARGGPVGRLDYTAARLRGPLLPHHAGLLRYSRATLFDAQAASDLRPRRSPRRSRAAPLSRPRIARRRPGSTRSLSASSPADPAPSASSRMRPEGDRHGAPRARPGRHRARRGADRLRADRPRSERRFEKLRSSSARRCVCA